MPFYKKVQKTFRVTKLDYAVTIMFLVVITWTVFYGIQPLKDDEGNVLYFKNSNGLDISSTVNDGTYHTKLDINAQVFLAPFILIYEMFQLFVLPGKTRLKYLPWKFWTALLIYIIYKKIKDGIDELSTT